jgi:hypothetical protein
MELGIGILIGIVTGWVMGFPIRAIRDAWKSRHKSHDDILAEKLGQFLSRAKAGEKFVIRRD